MNRKIQLFCIPYAGGIADSFRELAELLALSQGSKCTAEAESMLVEGNVVHSGNSTAADMTSEKAVEILPVLLEYAGHGTRKTEPFYADFDEMTEDIAGQIREKRIPEYEFALLGYSMGSIVLYEILAKELLGEVPCHIFVAAHEAPDIHWECKA